MLLSLGIALAAWATPGDELRFVPPDHGVLVKTFHDAWRTTDVECVSLIDTKEMEWPAQHPQQSLERTIVVADRRELTADVARLLRAFERLDALQDSTIRRDLANARIEYGPIDLDSDLDGKTVVFETYTETGETTRRFLDGDGSERALEGLVLPTDLEAWLPANTSEQPDVWTVEGRHVAALFEPVGDLAWHRVGESRPRDSLAPAVSRAWKGEARLERRGAHLDGDSTLVRVRIRAELEADASGERPMGGGYMEQVRLHVACTLEGELTWNVSRNHFVELELRGPEQRIEEVRWPRESGAWGSGMRTTSRGERSVRARCEVRAP